MTVKKSNKPPVSASRKPKVQGNVHEDPNEFSDPAVDEGSEEEMDFSAADDDEGLGLDSEEEDGEAEEAEVKEPATAPATTAEFDPFSQVDHVDPVEYGIDGSVFADPKLVSEEVEADYSAQQEPTLKAPKARPGFTQKWVRYDVNGKPDRKNIAKTRRQGWFPRRGSSITPAERKIFPLSPVTGTNEHLININGMVLCEMTVARAKARKARVKQLNDNLNISIKENYFAEGEKQGVPVEYTNRSDVRRGHRRPVVADNRSEDEMDL